MTAFLLADTPNLFRTGVRCHGYEARPDYGAIMQLGCELGAVSAYAFVNPGVSSAFVATLRDKNFTVVGSNADDVDHSLIASAVRLHRRADWIVLCSGDGDYVPLVGLLQLTGVQVGVIAEPRCCSQELRQVANRFFPAPFVTTRRAQAKFATVAA